MITVALWITLQCKPGKEKELATFLEVARILSEHEPETITWYAVRLAPLSYAIFTSFRSDIGRQAHLSGRITDVLSTNAADLLSHPPHIHRADVVATK